MLKDDDLRKKYDRWGEKGLEDDFHGNRYESWDFYHEELGLYDEDHEIHVLDHKELINAISSDDVWFIKFYSERCSHCHDLGKCYILNIYKFLNKNSIFKKNIFEEYSTEHTKKFSKEYSKKKNSKTFIRKFRK